MRGNEWAPSSSDTLECSSREIASAARPLGSGNRLSEIALAALGADFAEHGIATIHKVRRENPTDYLRIGYSLCPRQLLVERTELAQFTDEELETLQRLLASERAKTINAHARLVKQIEREKRNGSVVEIEQSEPQDVVSDR